MGDHHDVGLGGGVQRRQQAAGPGSQHVPHALRAVGHRPVAAGAQPVDLLRAATGREVSALREDHEGVVAVQVGGEGADLVHDVVPAGDELGRDPVQQHVDHRVPGERLLEHHPRLAVVGVHQRVDQHEGVGRARVPAGDDQLASREGVRRRALRGDLEVHHALGLPEEHPGHGLHQLVVDALEVRRADPPPEAAGEPQPQQRRQQQRLQRQVEHEHPEEARRSPPAGHPGRRRGRAEQPQREAGPHRHPEQHHERGDDHPAHDPQQPGAHPAPAPPGSATPGPATPAPSR